VPPRNGQSGRPPPCDAKLSTKVTPYGEIQRRDDAQVRGSGGDHGMIAGERSKPNGRKTAAVTPSNSVKPAPTSVLAKETALEAPGFKGHGRCAAARSASSTRLTAPKTPPHCESV